MKVKSLVDLSWQVPEEEYRNDTAYSYSTIARFSREGFDNIGKIFDKTESSSLTFGSVVDTLMTDGPEAFEEKFMVAEFPDIPQSMVKVITNLFDGYSDEYASLDEIPDDIIGRATVLNDYQLNWREQTRVKNIRDKGAEYYNLLYLSMNKTLINTETYEAALRCVEVLKGDPATEWYFRQDDVEGVERLYQLKFKGEWQGIPLRCMADLIIVDHINKKIYPCDLKTSGHKEWEFHKSFVQWGYYIQAQLYWYIIRQVLDKDPIYKDYSLENYRFIVVNKDNLKPLVWEFKGTQATVDISVGEHTLRNWRSLVKELHYYLTNQPKYPIGIQEENDILEWLSK